MEKSLGIIGGADGPTAILVSESIESSLKTVFGSGIAIGLGVGILIAVATGFAVYFATKRKFTK